MKRNVHINWIGGIHTSIVSSPPTARRNGQVSKPQRSVRAPRGSTTAASANSLLSLLPHLQMTSSTGPGPPLPAPPRAPPLRCCRDDLPPRHRRMGGAPGPRLGRGRGRLQRSYSLLLTVRRHRRPLQRHQGGPVTIPNVKVRCSRRVC
jgi:hypothetical protein